MEHLQLVTFGPRGHAKTTFFAALHAERSGGGLSLKCEDDATLRYLRPLAQDLKAGNFPPFTRPNEPTTLRFQTSVGGKLYALAFADFAGELTDPIWQKGPEQLRLSVEAWTARCDGLLIFVDATRGDDVEYLDVLDKLMKVLRLARTKNGNRRRVIHVVYTKADEVPSATPAALAKPDAAASLLPGHRIRHRLLELLAEMGSETVWSESLMSAVGWHFSRVPTAHRKLQPCNLFEPLRWVIEQSGKVVVQSRTRRRLAGLYAAAAALLLLFGLWYLLRTVQQSAYARHEQQVASLAGDEQARKRVEAYERHIVGRRFDWLWGLTGQRTRADQQAEADRRIVARQDAEAAYAALCDNDARLDRQGLHPARYAAATEFLQRHGEHAPLACRDGAVGVQARTKAAWDSEREAWRAARDATSDRLADKDAKITALSAYLRRADALDRDAATAELAGVRQAREQLLADDKRNWEAVRDQAIEGLAGYAAKRTALQAYAGTVDAQYQADACRLADTLHERERLDRSEYGALAGRAARAKTSEEIEAIEQKARDYLAATGHDRSLRATVQGWLLQLETFKQPRAVHITVRGVSIPSGDGFLRIEWTGAPKPEVVLAVGGQSWKNTTPPETWKDGTRDPGSINLKYGPFTVVWGQRQTLKLTLTVKRTLAAEEVATTELSDDVYILNHANGRATIPTGAGPIELDLECPDARPPVFPASR